MTTADQPQALELANGRLAALSWGRQTAPVWLALHGWLDNAASFSRLAPSLAHALDIRIVALDFRGHGHSAVLSAPETPSAMQDIALWDYCHDVLDALDTLEIEQVTLLAHSMGAAVSCLLAAALPERIEQLILLDGLGALTSPPEEASTQLRKGLLAHRRPASQTPRYADLESAVAARVAGGVTPIDADTARPLMARNSRLGSDGQCYLRTDRRLMKPSMVRFTPDQVQALLNDIRCPVLLIEGEQGILGDRQWAVTCRRAVADLVRHVLPGGHHLHLEQAAVPRVASTIVDYQLTRKDALLHATP
ncbi:alpha/beta fold hydrolase [Halomonas sp. LS-001]